ncbi:hypothetical protein IC9_02532 [Bacillus toyonensis]|nr:hypothetical protein IGO_02754 [Bacillus toyonensis]MDF9885701.1 hypothetical protein [Bacillus sp. LEw-kw-24]MDH6556522.1 hypothetical protein [Bacillus sp. LEw-kw-2]MDH8707995.1 hypothetical protein [Stenotrophomonas sp. 1198]MDP9746366.1 hypothetical protein [Bacillus thuringiensis]
MGIIFFNSYIFFIFVRYFLHNKNMCIQGIERTIVDGDIP